MYQIKDLIKEVSTLDVVSEVVSPDHPIAPFVSSSKSLIGPRWKDGWVCTESVMYQILCRGHSPASEPFRQWVTCIVLPILARQGSYNYDPEHGELAKALAVGSIDFNQCLKQLTAKHNLPRIANKLFK